MGIELERLHLEPHDSLRLAGEGTVPNCAGLATPTTERLIKRWFSSRLIYGVGRAARD